MRRRLIVALSLISLAAAGCTSDASPGDVDRSLPSLTAETLVLLTEAGPVAVRSPGGSIVLSEPGALTGANGFVYATSGAGDWTRLRTLSAGTGETASATRISGDYEIRVVSGSGRAAALMEPLPRGWDAWTPIPRTHTTIVVADPTGVAAPRTYVLEGNFEPEAFSTDDRRLFLIQHLPAETPSAYRVTVLRLRTGEVGPVIGPLKSRPERMPGTRLQQLASPSGDQLFTLYSSARPGYAPHDAPVPSDAVVSFVHVLDLEHGWAHCVGLPREMWNRPAGMQAMASSPDGRYLFLVDAGLGRIAVMNADSLVVRTAAVELTEAGEVRRTSAVMSADGETLYVATAGDATVVNAVDVSTFEVGGSWRLDGEGSGLGISSDGSRLYVAVGDRVVVLDPRNGRELGEVPLESRDRVVRIEALAA